MNATPTPCRRVPAQEVTSDCHQPVELGRNDHNHPTTTIPGVPTASLRIIRDGYPDQPALDTALSQALLLRASEGAVRETFRLNRPGRVVAFGKRDVISPQYRAAVDAARAYGYEAVQRLAGGRAAVFHEGTLAFSWTIPDTSPREGIATRFEMVSALIVRAFSRLGVSAEVGEVVGEYCPGRYSVHSGDLKIMGVGQRLARRAAHIGGVVVVSNSTALRDILAPVYGALDLDWKPETAGSLQDVSRTVSLESTTDAVLTELAVTRQFDETSFDSETMEMAMQLAPGLIPA